MAPPREGRRDLHLGGTVVSGSSPPGTVPLEPGERPPDRPFADPEATPSDLATLAAIRAAQRERIREERGSGTWTDGTGASHWLVAPRPELLVGHDSCLAIGFFGQAREGVDHGIIVSLEHDILARAAEIAGLLSYHNVQLGGGQWGNLVLFRAGTETALLGNDPSHADAIGRAPAHYHSLRLHRGTLRDGPLGAREFELATTLYLDFGVTPPWRAVRAA